MKVCFRVDSGEKIGGGHLARCITLAKALELSLGVTCYFLTGNHEGHLLKKISEEKFNYELLPLQFIPDYYSGDYKHWLGNDWLNDANEAVRYLESQEFTDQDWVVVDHYGIDQKWEAIISEKGYKVGVIDDLANRNHISSFLLDQTVGRSDKDYEKLTSPMCTLFTGEKYCLLRPDFLVYRTRALARRQGCKAPRTLLINFGSTDPLNHTSRVLKGIDSFAIKNNLRVVVVVGGKCAYINVIKTVIKKVDYDCSLQLDVKDMAKLMFGVDIAIGAAGATTWERCLMGIPTLLIKTAENQSFAIASVIRSGAAIEYIGEPENTKIGESLEKLISSYYEISSRASALIDGKGILRLVDFFSISKN